jgi:ABC-type sugar transport system substrate-binding protein
MRRLTVFTHLAVATSLLCGLSGAALAQGKTKIAFVPQIVGIPYFNAMEAGGKKAAADLGVDFIYSGPVDSNPVDQLQIVQNLINQGVSAVSVSVLDTSSIAPLVKDADQQHVKLFTSDSDAPDSGRPVYVAQASDEALGSTMVDELVKRVGPGATIGIVSGEPTASNLNAWIGFMQKRAAAKYPALKLLKPQYAGGTAQRAAQISADLMTSHPDMKGLIAVASVTCPGVAQAIETAGKIHKVIGAGYCSPNTARSYLKSGALGFTVLWDPSALGYLTVWAGKQLVDGKPFAANNTVPTLRAPVTFDSKTGVLLLGPPAVFTAGNVDKYNF